MATAVEAKVEVRTIPQRMTLAEFEEYPWGDDYEVELVRGEVRMSPLPAGVHSWIVRHVFLALHAHVSARGLGVVFADGTGYTLPGLDDTMRGPDVSFVAAGRLPDPIPLRGAFRLAPELAVEVVSPSDTYGRLEEKLDDYFAAGTRLVWLAHPRRRRVEVVLADGTRRSLGERDTLDGTPVLPDFTIAVADLFAGIEREG
jgi:Uma2 family endonuclease